MKYKVNLVLDSIEYVFKKYIYRLTGHSLTNSKNKRDKVRPLSKNTPTPSASTPAFSHSFTGRPVVLIVRFKKMIKLYDKNSDVNIDLIKFILKMLL